MRSGSENILHLHDKSYPDIYAKCQLFYLSNETRLTNSKKWAEAIQYIKTKAETSSQSQGQG